jgi:hypothetical protein
LNRSFSSSGLKERVSEGGLAVDKYPTTEPVVLEGYPMADFVLSNEKPVIDCTGRKFCRFLDIRVRHFRTHCDAIRCVNRARDLRSGE